MFASFTKPQFGGRRKGSYYYERINAIITPLRQVATLRLIAEQLNAKGYRTPTEQPWNRQRLANYLRSASI